MSSISGGCVKVGESSPEINVLQDHYPKFHLQQKQSDEKWQTNLLKLMYGLLFCKQTQEWLLRKGNIILAHYIQLIRMNYFSKPFPTCPSI